MSEKSINVLRAKQEITEQISRYCRAMDRLDADLGYSVWHEEAEAIYEASPYVGTGRGFIDWVIPMIGTEASASAQKFPMTFRKSLPWTCCRSPQPTRPSHSHRARQIGARLFIHGLAGAPALIVP